MSKRALSQFVCQSCGAEHPKWAGRCDACGAWNALQEEVAPEAVPKGLSAGAGKSKTARKVDFVGLEGPSAPVPRWTSGLSELDRVLGGGLVPGSAVLLGGDPGIGKSTLLMQAAAKLSASLPTVYVSGEEAIDQLRLRAERLGLSKSPVRLAAAANVRDLISALDKPEGSEDAARVVIIDSIQTMYVDTLESAPGTVSQVRSSAQELIRLAKRRGFALVLVGHVTKEGALAGPRVLEHMVDTVLYFEGERGHQFRILRAVKNRFGPADEIGVFEMTGTGLAEVLNPSALFLGGREQRVSGSAVFAGIEGSRPILVEIQALVAPSSLGTPRRAVIGWDSGRLAMVLAVLEARSGLALGSCDVYLNVAGGLRVQEPAADLAVAAALMSSHTGVPVPEDAVIFGEIGLSGEVRPVSHVDARLREAAKLGFQIAVMPATPKKKALPGIRRREVGEVHQLAGLFDEADRDLARKTSTPHPDAAQ